MHSCAGCRLAEFGPVGGPAAGRALD